MFNFLFLPAFVTYNFLTFGIQKYFKVSPQICTSLSIATNSILVSSSSYLFINNRINMPTMINSFQFTLAFMANDLWFRKHNDMPQGYWVKVLHHILAGIGIYHFPRIGVLIPTLFLSEISNIPLEIRNTMRHLKWKKYGIQGLMIALLYVSFGYLRIYHLPIYTWNYYQRGLMNNLDMFYFGSIYVLWCYWFLFINYKIASLIKETFSDFVSNKFKTFIQDKNLLENFRKSK